MDPSGQAQARKRCRAIRPAKSALTSLEAWVQLVDDVDAALAANQAVVTVTSLERLERILDLHCFDPRCWGEFTFARIYYIQKRAQGALFRLGVQITRPLVCVNHVKVFFPWQWPVLSGENPLFPRKCGGKRGHMAHLAAGSRFRLSIEVNQRVAPLQPVRKIKDIVADQVLHHAVGVAISVAERQA